MVAVNAENNPLHSIVVIYSAATLAGQQVNLMVKVQSSDIGDWAKAMPHGPVWLVAGEAVKVKSVPGAEGVVVPEGHPSLEGVSGFKDNECVVVVKVPVFGPAGDGETD